MLHVVVFHTLKTLFHRLWLSLFLLKSSLIATKFVFTMPPFVTGGKGAGHNFSNNGIALGQNINQLESHKTKAADKTRP